MGRAKRDGRKVEFAKDTFQASGSHMKEGGSAASQAPKEKKEGEEDNIMDKYRHLLEPLRDLALNWNVDIASELEKYLADLEEVQVSINGGRPVNFVEAALVIQGSTCVYSRKVEYLYQLVFRVLDIIADRERKEQENAGNMTTDQDADFPIEPEFISLDDIQEAKRSAIDMVEKDDEEDKLDTTLNKTPLGVIRMNISLEADPDNNDPNKDFKLASAIMHDSGALLLDNSFQGALNNSLQSVNNTPVLMPDHSLVRSSAKKSARKSTLAEHQEMQLESGAVDHQGAPDFEAPDLDDDDDDDDPSWDAFQVPVPEGKKRQKHVYNPWAMLDPHDATSANPKPFRRGTTSRRPKTNLDGSLKSEQTNRIDPRTYQIRSLHLPYFADFVPSYMCERKRVMAQRLTSARLRKETATALTDAQLDDLALGLDMEVDDYDEVDLPYLGNAGDMMAHDDGDWGAGDDDGDDDMEDLPPALGDDVPRTPGNISVGSARGVGHDGEAYEDMCRKYVEKYLKGLDKFVQTSGLVARVNQWQTRLEPKLAEEEAREAFDIHLYGERVKSLVSKQADKKKGIVSFAKAVTGMQRFDVCRSFLAALQLANDGNVEISLEDPLDRSTMQLQLIKVDSRHTAMVTSYVAPSVLSAQKKRRGAAADRRKSGLEEVIDNMPDPVTLRMSEEAGDLKEEEEDMDDEEIVAELLAQSALKEQAALKEGPGTQSSQMPTQDKKSAKRGAEGGASQGGKGKAGRSGGVNKNKENASVQK